MANSQRPQIRICSFASESHMNKVSSTSTERSASPPTCEDLLNTDINLFYNPPYANEARIGSTNPVNAPSNVNVNRARLRDAMGRALNSNSFEQEVSDRALVEIDPPPIRMYQKQNVAPVKRAQVNDTIVLGGDKSPSENRNTVGMNRDGAWTAGVIRNSRKANQVTITNPAMNTTGGNESNMPVPCTTISLDSINNETEVRNSSTNTYIITNPVDDESRRYPNGAPVVNTQSRTPMHRGITNDNVVRFPASNTFVIQNPAGITPTVNPVGVLVHRPQMRAPVPTVVRPLVLQEVPPPIQPIGRPTTQPVMCPTAQPTLRSAIQPIVRPPIQSIVRQPSLGQLFPTANSTSSSVSQGRMQVPTGRMIVPASALPPMYPTPTFAPTAFRYPRPQAAVRHPITGVAHHNLVVVSQASPAIVYPNIHMATASSQTRLPSIPSTAQTQPNRLVIPSKATPEPYRLETNAPAAATTLFDQKHALLMKKFHESATPPNESNCHGVNSPQRYGYNLKECFVRVERLTSQKEERMKMKLREFSFWKKRKLQTEAAERNSVRSDCGILVNGGSADCLRSGETPDIVPLNLETTPPQYNQEDQLRWLLRGKNYTLPHCKICGESAQDIFLNMTTYQQTCRKCILGRPPDLKTILREVAELPDIILDNKEEENSQVKKVLGKVRERCKNALLNLPSKELPIPKRRKINILFSDSE